MQAEGSYFLSLTSCQCMGLEFEASLDYIVRLFPNKRTTTQKPQRLYLSLGLCCPVGRETVSHSGLDLCFAGGWRCGPSFHVPIVQVCIFGEMVIQGRWHNSVGKGALLPSLGTWAPSSGSAWWKERINFLKFSSVSHTCSVVCSSTHSVREWMM